MKRRNTEPLCPVITSSPRELVRRFHTFCMDYFWSQHDHLSAASLLFSNDCSNFSQSFETGAIRRRSERDDKR